jgi:isoleucyl-tRNA synthetase
MADYKDTIFLPKTDFPMKGNLATLEPELLRIWKETNLYQQIRHTRQGSPKFILHWGPPYANGHLHAGHAFTSIFKDIVCRSHTLLGKDAPQVPGWDCHGLPIEWKIEEKYLKAGKKKEDVSIIEFRQECREFAAHWVTIQNEEFQRLGICYDAQNPYITMDFDAEAGIAAEIFKFLENGSLYKGVRPIMWSVVEKTALAEAEIEYIDKKSPSIYVQFPVIKASRESLAGASIVIWTTTPWTLPGNRAIVYNEEVEYAVIEYDAHKLVIALPLLETVCNICQIKDYKIVDRFLGREFQGTICHHPLHNMGYEFEVPVLPGEHVTIEAGTGLVHTAPGHGEEDFEVGKKFHLEIPDTIADDGRFHKSVPLFAGLHVFKADEAIIEKLKENHRLLWQGQVTHSYPHSWRSKAPLIFRTTPQWFISMETTGLREKALQQIKKTNWFPSQSENRITGMIETRPDWCISRQRAWGVPLPFFVHKETKKVLIDKALNQKIVEIFRKEGCDAWFTSDPDRFLAPQYSKNDYEQVKDIVDVWFDAGSTQGFVLEQRPELGRPADVYLEGSDQHRGWFQSSLLIGCGTRGNAPFKSVVTHGFTVDEQGHKMSKSLGNMFPVQEATKELGAEIIRLWVVSCDYSDDLRIGKALVKHQQDIYRRYRNTIRYLLGALSGFSEGKVIKYAELPLLEKWVLHRLNEFNQSFAQAIENYEYQWFYSRLHSFCATDLSAFYFDIRKDSLYCDDPSDTKRQAALWVMDQLCHLLLLWLQPVLCFTTEEAWQYRYNNKRGLLQTATLPSLPQEWQNQSHADEFEQVRHVRRLLTGALERARADGIIGSSLQASVTLFDPNSQLNPKYDLSELAIVSQLEVLNTEIPSEAFTLQDLQQLGVLVQMAPGNKCERCWRVLPEVGKQPDYDDLCKRCAGVVRKHA